jgi:hypothetical protein
LLGQVDVFAFAELDGHVWLTEVESLTLRPHYEKGCGLTAFSSLPYHDCHDIRSSYPPPREPEDSDAHR